MSVPPKRLQPPAHRGRTKADWSCDLKPLTHNGTIDNYGEVEIVCQFKLGNAKIIPTAEGKISRRTKWSQTKQPGSQLGFGLIRLVCEVE
jgi:hypothetical protein